MKVISSKYTFEECRKAVASFLVGMGGFLIVALPLLTDGNVTNPDIIATIAALATWIGGTVVVFQVPNERL